MTEQAHYIASGTVISGKEEVSGEYAFRLKLTKVLKGKPVEILDLHSPADSCGMRIPVGQSVDVVAFPRRNSTDGKLYINSCSLLCAHENGMFDRLRKNGRPVQ